MISKSELTDRWYHDEDVVFFRNLYQCAFYIKNHCLPIDIFTDGNDKLVMVFDRQQHNELIKLWIANKDICDKDKE
jgi:hypothetical protein